MALEQLLLKSASEGNKVRRELNRGYYFTSFLESPYLYHTTHWKRLKNILKEGFLAGNPTYLKNKKIHQLHPNMICFTTSKWRHLSNMPSLGWIGMLGITHVCYLKIPFKLLKDKVKPVIYKVSEHEIEDLLESGQAYYLATLTQREDKLKQEYGELYKDYLYHTWFCENEWRMKADKFMLPPETEVYVSSYYQLKKAKTLTDLPVYLDHEIMHLRNRLEFPHRIRRKIVRVIGKDLTIHGIKGTISVHREPIRRPDGSTTKIHATLYDVTFLHGITIIKRLKKAGFRVWMFPNAWKYRPYADIEVDLTFITKPEQNIPT